MMNKTNNTISKKSLADEVAEKIREQIISGHYQENEKLPIEPALMKDFGVGRSTVREAIKLLANSGFLRVQQGLGTFVENVSGITEPLAQRLKRTNTEELDEVRELLEMKIAEKAAVNRTEEDLTNINKWLRARYEAANDGLINDCIEADIQFHKAIAEASKSAILIDLYQSLANHLRSWFSANATDVNMFKDSYQLHKNLVESIEAGNPKKAWRSVAKIIGHVSQ